MTAQPEPPEGTIALLFTDIEGSTRLARSLGAAWRGVLGDYHRLIGDAITSRGGYIDNREGDSVFAAFASAADAARAAVAAMRALAEHEWPEVAGALSVRMGLHVGEARHTVFGYVGLEVHRAARVAAAGHGGQLLLTGPAASLTRNVLVAEPLGLHRLKDFPAPEQIFLAVIDGRGADAFPPLRTLSVRDTNLPALRPVPIGRDEDLRRICDAFLSDGDRVVTLTGRGGTGKTTLAIEASARLLDAHPGGVWWVPLDRLAPGSEVMPAIATAVRADGAPGQQPIEAVVDHLAGRRGQVLLMLDNFEHVLSRAGDVAALLTALPELRVLVTSQVTLGLIAERVLRIETLDDESGLRLVRHVADRVSVALGDDAATRAALLRVVHLLDGLPLALELAAARLTTLTPAQLADRLATSPSVLRDTRGERPLRQRSLQATVDWTLGLLDPGPRTLFTRLGVFAGPVELEQVEAVTAGEELDVLDALAVLIDVALVRRIDDARGRVRFGLPAALRVVAAAELDASPGGQELRRAHAERQRDVAWAARLAWLTPGADYLAAERSAPEAAAALAWARAAGEGVAAPLGAAMGARLVDGGRVREALAVLEPLVEVPSGDPVVDGTALAAASSALGVANRVDEAFAAGERAMAVTSDAGVHCFALGMLSFLHLLGGDVDAAVRAATRGREVSSGLGPAVRAGALVMEAQARMRAGEVDVAAEQLAEAQRIGAPVDAKLLWALESLLADLDLQRGRPAEAVPHFVQSLIDAEARGNSQQVLFDLVGLAHALSLSGAAAEAYQVIGMAQAHAKDMSGPAATIDHLVNRSRMAPARDALSTAEAEAQAAAGREVESARRAALAYELGRVVTGRVRA